MIHVTLAHTKDTLGRCVFALGAHGHADHEKEDGHLVCAATSALTTSLRDFLLRLDAEWPEARLLEAGNLSLTWIPTTRRSALASLGAVSMFLGGMESLSEDHPDMVMTEKGGFESLLVEILTV